MDVDTINGLVRRLETAVYSADPVRTPFALFTGTDNAVVDRYLNNEFALKEEEFPTPQGAHVRRRRGEMQSAQSLYYELPGLIQYLRQSNTFDEPFINNERAHILAGLARATAEIHVVEAIAGTAASIERHPKKREERMDDIQARNEIMRATFLDQVSFVDYVSTSWDIIIARDAHDKTARLMMNEMGHPEHPGYGMMQTLYMRNHPKDIQDLAEEQIAFAMRRAEQAWN